MQISSSSAQTSSMALQVLRDLFQTPSTATTKGDAGQILPTDVSRADAKGPPPGAPPGPPPAGLNGGGFSADILSSLLGTQEASSTDAAGKLIDAADTNGDGTVSLDELAASLSADSTTLADAFGKVDKDGDGQITATELDAALKAKPGHHGHHGPHGPDGPPSASDAALHVLASVDTDKSGSLSLSEIGAALGKDDTSSLSSGFASLDTNGDGVLASDELTKGIEAAFARSLSAYTAAATPQTVGTVSLAA